MIVGVDARSLTRPLTGIGRYTFEICRVLSNFQNITLILYSPFPLIQNFSGLENAIIKTGHKKNAESRLRLPSQLWAETKLPFLIKKDRVDLFWGPAHFRPRFLPKQTASVVTIHDLVWKFAKQTMQTTTYWMDRYRMPFAVRNSDQVIAVSQSTAQDITNEFNLNKNKLKIIFHGTTNVKTSCLTIDCALSQKKLNEIDLPENYFLFVGTLEPRKNLLRLLQAYAALPQELKNSVTFVIAGGKGWGNLEISKIIDQLQLHNHVKVIGYITDETLAILYSNALFLAMPSLYEGFGLPILEAMTCGIPVLTSQTSSMPEVAGDAGIFVDPLNVQSIQNGLEQLLTNQTLRLTLASRAEKNAKRFDWQTSGVQMLNVFQEARDVKNFTNI